MSHGFAPEALLGPRVLLSAIAACVIAGGCASAGPPAANPDATGGEPGNSGGSDGGVGVGGSPGQVATGGGSGGGGGRAAAGGRPGSGGLAGGGPTAGAAGVGRAGTAGESGIGGAAGGKGGSAGGQAGASAALAGVCDPGQAHDHNLNNDNWAGTLTLFISYSADTRSQTVDKGYTPAQWNAAVDSFDVPSFATQVANTGAKNILLMLGQNTGYYNSPNTVYEQYAGVAANTRCSRRDLPMEIADALSAKGVGMYLYLPEDVGWGDTKARQRLRPVVAGGQQLGGRCDLYARNGTPSLRSGRIVTVRRCAGGFSTGTRRAGASRRRWPTPTPQPARRRIPAPS